MLLNLIRNIRSGQAIRGAITLPFDERKPIVCETLENADFLIPDGTYPLKMTWSPRFKKDMPEICDVPEREGIRIHMGTRPEHSQGCVLVNFMSLENIKAFINRIDKWYENEPLYIRIESRLEQDPEHRD